MEKQFDIKNIRAIIGLGNPGPKYVKHRHSIGFRVLDALADHLMVQWNSVEKMEYATARLPSGQEMHLIKPLTFMNSSGQVLPWLQKKGIKPDQILVVHDELEKKFGQLVFNISGSHKGHNGLRSIISMIGPDFWRLKFGVGRPDDREQVPNYVLTDFPKNEEAEIPLLIDKVVSMICGT